VFPVQVDVRPLCSSASDVEVPPPIGVGGESIAGVLVQAVVVFVPAESDHHSSDEYHRPVGTDDGEESAGQHVELRLAWGKVEIGWERGTERVAMGVQVICSTLLIGSRHAHLSVVCVSCLKRRRQIAKADTSVKREKELYRTALEYEAKAAADRSSA
jgi:hypothetical protein